jgi:hypothetical protein
MIAFEIFVNGRQVCVAGGTSMFSAMLSYVDDGSPEANLNITGAQQEIGAMKIFHWLMSNLNIGDELQIRLIDTQKVDAPQPLPGPESE